MTNNIIYFLTENKVPAEELGYNWSIFEIIAIVVATLPWIVLIVYLVFLKKYRVRYFVNGELVNTAYYKKNQIINDFKYNNISKWYLDEECSAEYINSNITDNLKLYSKTTDENE